MNNRDKFEQTLMEQLGRLHAAGIYPWPASQMPKIHAHIMASIKARGANKDGPAVAATMKALGIPSTYKALYNFIGS